MPTVAAQIDAALGHACALAGRPAEAEALLEDATGLAAKIFAEVHSRATIWLGDARRRPGRTEEAGRIARTGLALARERGERGNQAYALSLLGEVAAALAIPDAPAAEASFAEGLALARELGMRPRPR